MIKKVNKAGTQTKNKNKNQKSLKAKSNNNRISGWNLFALIVGIVGIVGSIVTIISYKIYLKDKKVNSISGIIESPIKAQRRIFAIGSARFTFEARDNVLLREDNEPLISLYKINEEMYISTIIKNNKGQIVAKLEKNEWQLNRDGYFDRNFNKNALEIIDHTGKVILQVVDFGDIIHFAGVFHRKDGSSFSLIPEGEYGAIMEIGSNKAQVHIPSTYTGKHPELIHHARFDNPMITPIFKYPSDRHLGLCTGLKELEKLVRQSDINDIGYLLAGSLDIGTNKSLK